MSTRTHGKHEALCGLWASVDRNPSCARTPVTHENSTRLVRVAILLRNNDVLFATYGRAHSREPEHFREVCEATMHDVDEAMEMLYTTIPVTDSDKGEEAQLWWLKNRELLVSQISIFL